MKQYFKPVVLSGGIGTEPDDPITPEIGSQIGPTGAKSIDLLNNVAPASPLDSAVDTQDTIASVQIPFERDPASYAPGEEG